MDVGILDGGGGEVEVVAVGSVVVRSDYFFSFIVRECNGLVFFFFGKIWTVNYLDTINY